MIDDDELDANLEAEVLVHSKQIYSHMIVASLLLLVCVGIAVGGLMLLGNLIQSADTLLAIKPENRAEMLHKKIQLARRNTENAYAAEFAKMENKSIYDINNKFKVMYKLSLQFEQDYADTLVAYQQASFNIASRIRGSGEWYFYYERELNQLVGLQQQHQQQLQNYLSTLE